MTMQQKAMFVIGKNDEDLVADGTQQLLEALNQSDVSKQKPSALSAHS